jgi:hypothetical protein
MHHRVMPTRPTVTVNAHSSRDMATVNERSSRGEMNLRLNADPDSAVPIARGISLRNRRVPNGSQQPLPVRPTPVPSQPTPAPGHPQQGQVQGQERQRAGVNLVNGRPVLVATFSDSANSYVCNLLWSATKFNVSVQVLGFTPPSDVPGNGLGIIRTGFNTGESSAFQDLRRLDALEKELQSLSSEYADAIIMWIDADVLFQQPLEPAVSAFQTTSGSPSLVWSAEKTCWPAGALCSMYAPSNDQNEFSFLNCGAAIGYLHAFLRFFETIRRHRIPNAVASAIHMRPMVVSSAGRQVTVEPRMDQELVQALVADEETNRYVGGMAIDRTSRIFFSLGGGGAADLTENLNRGPEDLAIYRHARTGATPVVLHFNGESKAPGNHHYAAAQRRPEPRAFQETVLMRIPAVLPASRSLCAACSVFWLIFVNPAYPIGYFKRLVDFWRDNATFVYNFGTPCERADATCTPANVEFYQSWQLSEASIASASGVEVTWHVT